MLALTAAEVLELIDLDEVQTWITHPAQWEFGDETTTAPFMNRKVYNQLSAGQWDHSIKADSHVLTHNPPMGYEGLVRENPNPTRAPAPRRARNRRGTPSHCWWKTTYTPSL